MGSMLVDQGPLKVKQPVKTEVFYWINSAIKRLFIAAVNNGLEALHGLTFTKVGFRLAASRRNLQGSSAFKEGLEALGD